MARRIFAKMAALRLVQHKGAVAEGIDVGEAIFSHLPADTGQFGTPYFAHVLRGLMRTAPSYVESVLEGGPLPDWMPPTIRGMAVLSA